jgi:integrase
MAIHKLTARFVETAKDGLHSDGGNLFLQVRNRGKGRSWIFQYQGKDGRTKNMGLGSAATVALADARQTAQAQHRLLDDGKDPLEERNNKQLERDARAGVAVTVRELAEEYYEKKIAKKSRNYRKSFVRFADHIDKTLGAMPVVTVTPAVICNQAELSKWWVEKHPAAIQLLTHLKRMFSMAMAQRSISVNPAAFRDNLEHLLPDHAHKVEHRASLDHKDLAKFMVDLRSYEDRSVRKTGHTTVAYAVEFAILTGARVDEVCRAQWKEIDGDVWSVPPEHLKMGHKHGQVRRRPITASMKDVLTAMDRRHPDHSRDDLIFPSEMGGKIDGSTLGNFVRKVMQWPIKITAHGFRATFTDWARAKEYPEYWIDAQLDHLPPGKVRQAYIRNDLLPERKKMMEAYDAYAHRPEPFGGKVIDLRKAKA